MSMKKKKTNTYSKSEVDAKIPVATDLTNYYTKPQTDDLINKAIPSGYFNPFLSYFPFVTEQTKFYAKKYIKIFSHF